MKILAVHVDGLLTETTDRIYNTDPIVRNIEVVKMTLQGWLGSTLYIAEHGPADTVRAWLNMVGLTPTWVDVYENMNSMERCERVLSSVGERMGALELFISSMVYDSTLMAGEGVTSIHLITASKVKNWGPEPGTAWEKRMAELGETDEEE